LLRATATQTGAQQSSKKIKKIVLPLAYIAYRKKERKHSIHSIHSFPVNKLSLSLSAQGLWR
jgi:hypothetical protein